MGREQRVTNSELETAAIARALAKRLSAGDVVLFYGSLGAGKTAFVRGMLEYFDAAVTVTSPTYTLINVYPTTPPIYHFDLYRLRGENDLLDVGFEEYLDSNGIVLVEWAEKCGRLKPTRGWEVSLTIQGESTRQISWGRIEDENIGS